MNMIRNLTRAFLAALAIGAATIGVNAQSSNPFNPDYSFCSTQGAVATRNATTWSCLTPGTNGQVLRTNGAGANVSWQTVTGTGTVTSVGLSLPSQFTVTGSPVTGAGTLTGAWASQTANTLLAAPNGSAGAPTFRAMVAADMPNAGVAGTGALTGTWPNLTVGSNQLTTAMLQNNAVTLAKIQTIAANTVVANVTGGTAAPTAVTVPSLLDTTFTGTGIMRRTGVATYTTGTTVSVAEGGTGSTSASGTALDNISGMAGTGIVRRTGAGTYTQGTQVATGEIADGSITTAKLATPAASGASEVLIGTYTATNQATLSAPNIFSTTYDEYRIVINAISLTNDAMPFAQFGASSVYQTAGYDYTSVYSGTTTSGVTTAQAVNSSGIAIFGGVDNANAAFGGADIEMVCMRPATSGNFKRCRFDSEATNGLAWFRFSGMGVYRNDSNAYTDLRILFNTGNITGTMRVYGIRKS